MLLGETSVQKLVQITKEKNAWRENKDVVGIVDDKGNRLVNFCEDNNMVIGGAIFQNKNIHKWTWTLLYR